jgi:integrase
LVFECKHPKHDLAKRLIFTNADGTPITKGQIEYQIEKAIKETGIKKFTFHCYRNTALTEWARRGMSVDHAMLASGHSSVQMHKRYVRLQAQDIAEHFQTGSQMATGIATRKRPASAK